MTLKGAFSILVFLGSVSYGYADSISMAQEAAAQNAASQASAQAAQDKASQAAQTTTNGVAANVSGGTNSQTNAQQAITDNAAAKQQLADAKAKNKAGNMQAMNAMLGSMGTMAQAMQELQDPKTAPKGAIGMAQGLVQMMMAMANAKQNQADAAGADAVLGAQSSVDGALRPIEQGGGLDSGDPTDTGKVGLTDDGKNALKDFIKKGENGDLKGVDPNQLQGALIQAKDLLAKNEGSGSPSSGGATGAVGAVSLGNNDDLLNKALASAKPGGGPVAKSDEGSNGSSDSGSAGGPTDTAGFGGSSDKSKAGPSDQSGLSGILFSNGLDVLDEKTEKPMTLWQRAKRRYQANQRAFALARLESIRKKGLPNAPLTSVTAPQAIRAPANVPVAPPAAPAVVPTIKPASLTMPLR